jgi:hypothetical protein
MRKNQLSRRKSKEMRAEERPFFKSNKEAPKEPFFKNKAIQPKLSVSKPGDASEIQADKIADQYVSNVQKQDKEPSPIDRAVEEEMQTRMMRQDEEELQAQQEEEEINAQASEEEELQAQNEEEELQTELLRQEEEEELQTELQRQEEEEVQTKTIHPKGETDNPINFEAQLDAAKKAGGFPLSDNIRNEYEGFFKKDLKKVRIHTGEEAVQLCQKIKAQAFTHGNHIFFNKGKYAPETAAGKHLLAHELTHYVQTN